MSVNILQTLDDPALLGQGFDAASWRPWRAALACLLGLDLDEDQRELVRQCTGRDDLPGAPFREAWLCCGRRSGKSRIMALLAVYLACFVDWRPYLAPGERATVALIAADRKQARVALRYIRGLLTGSPLLAQLVEGERADEAIRLANRVTIEVMTASAARVRGYSLATAILDEVAFWTTDEAGADCDQDILAALRPALATLPGSMLIAASSPHARRGALWQAIQRYHGVAGAPVLTWRAATRTMNATIPAELVQAEFERDPHRARAEWLAEFRSDVAAFITPEVVAEAVVPGRRALPPDPSVRHVAFLDPSGGSSDSMALAIAHLSNDKVILDYLEEIRAPFNPQEQICRLANTVRRFGAGALHGDNFGAGWVAGAFMAQGIEYRRCERSKSQLYAELLPLLNSGQVELLDHDRLRAQLLALERRVSRAGKDVIDHPPSGRDDCANAAAGALVLAHELAARAFDADSFIFGEPGIAIERSAPWRIGQHEPPPDDEGEDEVGEPGGLMVVSNSKIERGWW